MDRRGKIAAAGIAGAVAGFMFGSGTGIATGGDAYNGAIPFAAIGFALCALATALVTEPRNRSGPVAPASVGGMNMGKASDMNGKATLRGEVAVSELGTGGKPGDNTIVIAMTRDAAGWFKDVLKYYISEGQAPHYKAVCVELSEKTLDEMNRCFPDSPPIR